MESARFAWPSAPTAGATVTMFDSSAAFSKKMMRTVDCTRVQVNFLSVDVASATNGLKAYGSSDGGTNWDQVDLNGTMPATVAASTSGQDNSHDFWVAKYDDFKVTYTCGTTGVSTWRGTTTVYFHEVHPGS